MKVIAQITGLVARLSHGAVEALGFSSRRRSLDARIERLARLRMYRGRLPSRIGFDRLEANERC